LLSLEIEKLPVCWRESLAPYIRTPKIKCAINNLNNFLSENFYDFHPSSKKLLLPMHLTKLDSVKVVIVGHYPYPNKAAATGLPFSAPKGIKAPLSAQRIYQSMVNDFGGDLPNHGNFDHLPSQGVLLLNRKMTTGRVFRNNPNGHSDVGWEQFSLAIIEMLSNKLPKVVFLLWGAAARQVKPELSKRHLILEAPHPSSRFGYGAEEFLHCRHFSKTNEFIVKNGIGEEIKWFPS